jgi:uncharacterized coiled-coil DUF342 family protein
MKKKLVIEYMNNPEISQKQLADKYDIPYQHVVNLLRSKRHGLTAFQRYKRNRDRLILQKWTNYNNEIKQVREQRKATLSKCNNKIKKVRQRRNLIAGQFGLTQSTLNQLLYRKGSK